MLDNGTTRADVLGDDVATKRNHSGMLDFLVLEDGYIGGTTANVNEHNTRVLFFLIKNSLCRGNRLKDHVIHVQTSVLDAMDDVLGRRGLSDDDMEVGFNLIPQHSHRVGGQLAIDIGVLTNDIDDFLARRHVDLKGVVAQTLQFSLRDFGLVVVAHQNATVLQTLDVLTGDAHADTVDFDARLVRGLLDRRLDGLDGVEDIGDHATTHTCGYGLAVPQDFNFSFVGLPAHDTSHFGGADVQSDDDFSFAHNIIVLYRLFDFYNSD